MQEIAFFQNISDALQWRALYGGWLFAPESEDGYWWFYRSYTASKVMTHRAVRELPGELI